MSVAHTSYTSAVAASDGESGPITQTASVTETGANPYVRVSISVTNAFGSLIGDEDVYITNVTLDGKAMTFWGVQSAGGRDLYVYYATGAVGTNKTIEVTYETDSNNALVFTSSIIACTRTGVRQDAPIKETTTTTGTSRNPDGTLTSDSADNMIEDCTVVYRGSATYTLTEDGAGTNRGMNLVGSSLARHYNCCSDVVGSGAKNMSYNVSGTTNVSWRMIIFELEAASVGRRRFVSC